LQVTPKEKKHFPEPLSSSETAMGFELSLCGEKPVVYNCMHYAMAVYGTAYFPDVTHQF
jgi:hypothetical protein